MTSPSAASLTSFLDGSEREVRERVRARLADRALAPPVGLETGPHRRWVDALVAAVKTAATWHAVSSVQTCRESCGGRGYMSDMRLGSIRADVDVFTTFEGDNTVLLQLVARSLLKDFRAEFEVATRREMARHLARPAAVRLVTMGPDTSGRVAQIGFALEALRWRE